MRYDLYEAVLRPKCEVVALSRVPRSPSPAPALALAPVHSPSQPPSPMGEPPSLSLSPAPQSLAYLTSSGPSSTNHRLLSPLTSVHRRLRASPDLDRMSGEGGPAGDQARHNSPDNTGFMLMWKTQEERDERRFSSTKPGTPKKRQSAEFQTRHSMSPSRGSFKDELPQFLRYREPSLSPVPRRSLELPSGFPITEKSYSSYTQTVSVRPAESPSLANWFGVPKFMQNILGIAPAREHNEGEDDTMESTTAFSVQAEDEREVASQLVDEAITSACESLGSQKMESARRRSSVRRSSVRRTSVRRSSERNEMVGQHHRGLSISVPNFPVPPDKEPLVNHSHENLPEQTQATPDSVESEEGERAEYGTQTALDRHTQTPFLIPDRPTSFHDQVRERSKSPIKTHPGLIPLNDTPEDALEKLFNTFAN